MNYAVVKMTTKKRPRPYRQRLRAESAAMTRQRIIDAAREALTDQPIRSFNISEVADRAGVVRSTIYTVFGSRQGLLRAVVDDVVERGGWERMREAFRHPDALVAVARNLEEGTRLTASGHNVFAAISTLAAVDADAAAVIAETDAQRLKGLHVMIRRLREQGYLRPELEHEQAVDILYLLSDWRAVDRLYSDRGLDDTAVAERLVTMATLTLCRPETLTAADSSVPPPDDDTDTP
jgi:AcrR family transcriptional regulator